MALEDWTDKNGKKLFTPIDGKDAEAEFRKLSEEEKRQATIRGNIFGFYDDIKNHNLFQAHSRIGIFQSLRVPDVAFYVGLLKRESDDIDGAIESFESVPRDSENYLFAQKYLTSLYTKAGSYEKLCSLFASGNVQFSAIRMFAAQLTCLARRAEGCSADQLEKIVEAYPVVKVTTIGNDNEDRSAFYNVRKTIANVFSVAYECMKSCALHADRVNYPIDNFETDPDIAPYVNAYNIEIILLRCASNLSYINDLVKLATNSTHTLDHIALSAQKWPVKIKMIYKQEYIRQVATIIANLWNPETASGPEKTAIVLDMMECLYHINPQFILIMIKPYLKEIIGEAEKGNIKAENYLAFAYGDILALNKDRYGLSEEIEKHFKNNTQYDPQEVLIRRKLSLLLSSDANTALLTAEQSYSETKGQYYGVRDASSLALQFFRVVETEYNDHIIKPFVSLIDVEKLRALVDEWARKTGKQDEKEKWNKDIDNIESIKSGKKNGMECGTMRNLLYHIFDRENRVSLEMFNALTSVLSNDGLQAFLSKRMMRIISKTNLENFRNPGAHMGYISYSNACKAREYVLSVLPDVITWYKK